MTDRDFEHGAGGLGSELRDVDSLAANGRTTPPTDPAQRPRSPGGPLDPGKFQPGEAGGAADGRIAGEPRIDELQ